MAFAMRENPGTFTNFEFTPGVPAPFGMALAILRNTEMLTWAEKIQMVRDPCLAMTTDPGP